MASMRTSEEMLKMALIIRWLMAVSHCGLGVGTALDEMLVWNVYS
jgi:hypothetical protein